MYKTVDITVYKKSRPIVASKTRDIKIKLIVCESYDEFQMYAQTMLY